MDRDPIKQLQSFLDERGTVLEKISSIQASLGSLRADPAGEQTAQPVASAFSQPNESPTDGHYRRLMLALHEMQGQIEQRVRPAVQLVMQSQVDHLRGQSDEKIAALRGCLSQIDQSLLQCLAGLDEYQKSYADLAALNKDLAGLGAATEPLPEKLSAEHLSETIASRLASLSGKLRC